MKKENVPNVYDNNNVDQWRGDNTPKPDEKQPFFKTIKGKALLLFILFGLLSYGYSFIKNGRSQATPEPVKESSIKSFNQLPEPTADNFLDCYNTYDAMVTQSRTHDKVAAKLYANKMALVQYNMLASQIDALPMPDKNNVDDVRRKIYDIGWLSIKGYDETSVYFSESPMTQKYFQKKLSYVRLIADVYASMGYNEERIAAIMGDRAGNYYGIRN